MTRFTNLSRRYCPEYLAPPLAEWDNELVGKNWLYYLTESLGAVGEYENLISALTGSVNEDVGDYPGLITHHPWLTE